MDAKESFLKFLDQNKIKYELISHKTVYTAHDKAATLKVKPEIVGKTLVLRIDGRDFVLALIGANRNLDKAKFKKILNNWRKKKKEKAVKNIDFASERIIKEKFKPAKVGAIPPFGFFWKIPTFIDKALFSKSKIIVNIGEYDCSIKISPKIFKKLPDFIIASFGKVKK
jgi:prolyl-tRNA editing enzyme YbaK/EbsC (Cys-tRNA(Pro) deacylase)